MARRRKQSDAALIALFLDMLAAERGAGANTLAAYRARPRRFRRVSRARTAARIAKADDRRLRGYLAEPRRARLQGVVGRAAAVGDPPALSLPLCRGHRGDDPAAVLEGPEARPRAAEGAVDRGGRPAARRSARKAIDDETDARRQRLRAARLNCLLEVALRDRPARLRTGGAAGVGRAARRAHAGGARQGRQGAPGAAQRGRQARDGATISTLRAGRPRPRRAPVEMAVSLLRRERPPHAPAFRPRLKALARRRHSRRQVSARTCCATPSPAICCTTAPTCAWCRRCSAMPTSRPRRSIPMCWRSGSRAWCATCIRWRTK